MTPKQNAVEAMEFAHSLFVKMADSIPQDKAFFQIHPTTNHLVWTLGHLATTYSWFGSLVDAKGATKLPESYNTLFGMGSKPNPEKAKYPPMAEVRSNFDSSYAACLAAVRALTDANMWSVCAGDSHGLVSCRVDTAYKVAWHDGWHMGQIADIRRVLGLPSIFGA